MFEDERVKREYRAGKTNTEINRNRPIYTFKNRINRIRYMYNSVRFN
jgi:hypothetical protein